MAFLYLKRTFVIIHTWHRHDLFQKQRYYEQNLNGKMCNWYDSGFDAEL